MLKSSYHCIIVPAPKVLIADSHCSSIVQYSIHLSYAVFRSTEGDSYVSTWIQTRSKNLALTQDDRITPEEHLGNKTILVDWFAALALWLRRQAKSQYTSLQRWL